MRTLATLCAALAASFVSALTLAGEAVTYTVNGQSYEGYYSAPEVSMGLIYRVP